MSRDDPVEIEVTFIKCTSAAVLIEYDESEIWLPRSQLEFHGNFDHCQRGELVEIELPEWLAYEKDLI